MNHLLRMGDMERGGDIADHLGCLPGARAMVARPVGKVLALDPIHDQVGLAFVFVGGAHADDCRMLEPTRDVRFAPEPFEQAPGRELPKAQELEGDSLAGCGVGRLVDDAGPAPSDFTVETKWAEIGMRGTAVGQWLAGQRRILSINQALWICCVIAVWVTIKHGAQQTSGADLATVRRDQRGMTALTRGRVD